MSDNRETQSRWKLSRPTTMAILFIIVVTSAVVVAAYSLQLFNREKPVTSTLFTIIMSNQGFNDSRTHSDPWPVMNVRNGTTVTFHLRNEDIAEPHGFAITTYLDNGIEVRPGQSDDITITFDRPGTFLVYCNILCSIHTYMQRGQVNVIT